MARKKKHPEHENHERWLISYADFITLLFAFFVVMFASSQADKGKAQQVSESVKTALEKGPRPLLRSTYRAGARNPKAKADPSRPTTKTKRAARTTATKAERRKRSPNPRRRPPPISCLP